MRTLLAESIVLALAFALPAYAQETTVKPDRITLINGDVLHGKVLSLIEGKLKFDTASLGELEIPLDQITDLTTTALVTIETDDGERLQRRIIGIVDGQVSLSASPSGASRQMLIPREQLAAINPPEKKPEAWSGSLRAGLYLASGNTERRGGNAAVDAIRRTDLDRITAGLASNYAEDKTDGKRKLTQRRVQAGLKYDYFLSERSYLLVNTGVEGDTFQDIDLRFTAGTGYGYQWSETDELEFSTEIGVNYFSESFRSATPDDNYLALRAAYFLRWQISDGIKLLQDVRFFPSLESSDDIYLKKDSRLRFTVAAAKSMFTELQWELDYDNTPSSGLERIDNRFFVNVGWEF